LVSLFFGATVSAGVLLAFRGTDPLTPRLSGALAGLVGGLGGALAMGIACPSHEAWHLWFAHGLVVVVLGLFGFVVGRRILAP
ncbi:MAG TPA: NrsF family protein, partial [Polyangiaceae bacterium]